MSSSELSNLYQDLIMDHYRNPQGRGDHVDLPLQSHQLNPVCGDEITFGLQVDDGTITAVLWTGHGCAISQASASLLAGLIEVESVAQAHALIAEFREMMRSRGTVELDEDRFGDAIALNGVARYVARVKCAMLSWVAAEHALAGA